MRRRLFTVVWALSLLLCVAVCVLWVRSGWRDDWLLVRAGQWRLSLGSDKGMIGASLGTSQLTERPLYFRARAHPPQWHWLQFNAEAHGRVALVAFPHWLACLLLAVPPLRALCRRGSTPPHICRTCGYDLRATPDRCPECGTAPRAGVSA